MKKILFITLFVPFVLFGQSWNFSLDFEDFTTDTVIQKTDFSNVIGKDFTISINSADIDTVYTFDIGGSLIESNTVLHRMYFNSGRYRYLPYSIRPNIYDSITTFHGHSYPFRIPAFKFDRKTNTTGIIDVKIEFY